MHPALDSEVQAKAKVYQWRKHIWDWSRTALTIAALLAFYFSGISQLLASELAARLPQSLTVIVYFLIFFIGLWLLRLGFDYKSGYLIEQEYGFSTQGPGGWLIDQLKGLVVNLLILGGGVVFSYWVLLASPAWWWVWVGLGYVGLAVVLTNLFPVLVLPLFFKLKPLEDESLIERLRGVIARSRLKARGFYEMNMSSKTTKKSAMLAGLWNTKRVILGDTLLQENTPDETEVVTAHEVGHSHHLHLWQRFVVASLVIFVVLFLLNRIMVALFPAFAPPSRTLELALALLPLIVLGFIALNFAFSPLSKAFSRHLERQADRFALGATENREAFIQAMASLASRNYDDAYPHPLIKLFYYGHPPIGERLKAAERSNFR